MKKLLLLLTVGFFVIIKSNAYTSEALADTNCPKANAGPDISITTNHSFAQISGNIIGSSAGIQAYWSSAGSGTFSAQNSATTNYTPSQNDKSNGVVWLMLNVFNLDSSKNCPASSDTLKLTITTTTQPCSLIVNKTVSGKTVNYSAHLVDSTIAGNYFWSFGDGTNSTLKNPSHTYAANGSYGIVLDFTGDSSSGCITRFKENLFINDSSAPACAINFGIDIFSQSAYLTAEPTPSNFSGSYLWSFGDSTYATTKNATHKYSRGGTYTVTLTINSATCDATITKNVTVQDSIPTCNTAVNAGIDMTVPASQNFSSVYGQISGNTNKGIWSTSGSGVFLENDTLTTSYYFSQADVQNGFVVLTLTSTNNGTCSGEDDSMILTITTPAPSVCTVNFSKIKTENEVIFTGIQNDTVQGSFKWSFGDGTTGIGKTTKHLYAMSEFYMVTLVYTTPNSTCQKEDSILISEVTKETFTLSGNIKAGINNLDTGRVGLFKIDNQKLALVRNAFTSGSYSFSSLEPGTYLILAAAIPPSIYASQYLPTYSGNSGTWGGGAYINLSSNQISDISLIPLPVPVDSLWNKGNDIIKGFVGASNPNGRTSSIHAAVPLENAVVSLYNSNNEKLTSTTTDEFGNFEFTGIAAGNYTVKVDAAGTATPAPLSVVTDGNPATTPTATVQAAPEVVTGTASSATVNIISMYPNPTSEFISLELGTAAANAQIMIINNLGQLVLTENVNAAGTVSLNLNGYKAGLYYVKASANGKIFQGKFSVVR